MPTGLPLAARKRTNLDRTRGNPRRGAWSHQQGRRASPSVADGKVFLGTRSGNFYAWAAGKDKNVLCEMDLKVPISATVTAANGVLYVATMQNLYAIAPQREL